MASPYLWLPQNCMHRGQEGASEKVALHRTKQLIQLVFAHHLINTSRFVSSAALFQGWRCSPTTMVLFLSMNRRFLSQKGLHLAKKKQCFGFRETAACSLLCVIQVQQASLMLVLFPVWLHGASENVQNMISRNTKP